MINKIMQMRYDSLNIKYLKLKQEIETLKLQNKRLKRQLEKVSK